MQMRASGDACRPDRADDISGLHAIASFDGVAIEVGVTRDKAVTMIDHHNIAPGFMSLIIVRGGDHFASAGSIDRLAARRPKIDAFMGWAVSAQELALFTIAQGHIAFDGANRESFFDSRRSDSEGGLRASQTGRHNRAGAKTDFCCQRHGAAFRRAGQDRIEPLAPGAFVEGRERGNELACKTVTRIGGKPQSLHKTVSILPTVDAARQHQRISALFSGQICTRAYLMHERVEPEHSFRNRAKRKQGYVTAFDMRHFMGAHQRCILDGNPVEKVHGHNNNGTEESVDANAGDDMREDITRALLDTNSRPPGLKLSFQARFIQLVCIVEAIGEPDMTHRGQCKQHDEAVEIKHRRHPQDISKRNTARRFISGDDGLFRRDHDWSCRFHHGRKRRGGPQGKAEGCSNGRQEHRQCGDNQRRRPYCSGEGVCMQRVLLTASQA